MAKSKTVSIAADYEYDTTKIRNKDGSLRTSRGNGDAVAKAMLLFTAGGGELTTVVNANKLQERMAPHMKKKGPRAPGLQRMTLGVMLRAMVRNGTPVKIGKITVEKLSQKVEMPKVEKLSAAKPAPRKRGVGKPRKAAANKASAPRKARKPRTPKAEPALVEQAEAA